MSIFPGETVYEAEDDRSQREREREAYRAAGQDLDAAEMWEMACTRLPDQEG
jgi:hypothetical protein